MFPVLLLEAPVQSIWLGFCEPFVEQLGLSASSCLRHPAVILTLHSLPLPQHTHTPNLRRESA